MTAPASSAATIAPDPLAGFPPSTRWLLERATLEPSSLALLRPDLSLQSTYDVLLKAGEWASVIRMTAAALPARESIWWAWVSARYAIQQGANPPTSKIHTAMDKVEQWIVRPEDDIRRAAWDAGNAAGLDTPIGMVAAAVFLSGTSLAPVNTQPSPPPPGAAMPLIAGAILASAATVAKPDQVMPTTQAFAAQGLEIIKRLGGWESTLQVAFDTDQHAREAYDLAIKPKGGQ